MLLKSVLSAIPNFYLSIFKVPASIERKLSSIMRRFFWTGSKEGRGMALVAWDDICKPTGQGGLGVHHLKTMNVALLSKWVKRIVGPEEDVIGAVMRDRYGVGVDWDTLTISPRGASAFWRGLGKVVPSIQQFFVPSLGDGALFRFWLDEWSDKGCLRGEFPRLFALTQHPQGTVKECWDRGWNPSIAAHLSEQRVEEFMSMQQMLEGRRPRDDARDGWIWKNEPFSVRGLYRLLRTAQSEDPIRLDACREVWKQRVPLKVAIFAWIFARQRVLTRVRHRLLVSAGSALCMLCGEQEEDCEHLFFQCPIAIRIWASQGLSEIKSSVFWATIPRQRRGYEAERGRRFAVIWAIWLHRNEVVFEGKAVSSEGLIQEVERFVGAWFAHV